jgi:hypothetical protein
VREDSAANLSEPFRVPFSALFLVGALAIAIIGCCFDCFLEFLGHSAHSNTPQTMETRYGHD